MILKEVVEIECAQIERLDDGIILIKYRNDYEIELDDVKVVEKVLIDISNGEDFYCIVDTSGRFNNYTNEAQKFLSKEASIVKEGKMKCSAVLIDNLPQRMVVRFFINFFKPKFKMKVFGDISSAREWLQKEMNQH